MKPYFALLSTVVLLLGGERPGWGMVCATSSLRPAARPVQQDVASVGALHALVIFARFQDEDKGRTPAPGFASRLFDLELPGSLAHFYLEMSRGQFRLTGEHLPRWYASRRPAADYQAGEGGVGDFGEFVREILEAVDADTDLGQFDNDGPDGVPNSGDDDGYVDFIFINTLSSPQGFIFGGATGVARLKLEGGYTSNDRAVGGEFIRVRPDNHPKGLGGVIAQGHTFELATGSMAHEFGHFLGLPDLSDLSFANPEEDSAGIGYWGLMGHGARGWNDQGGPNPFCSWSLEQLGWVGVGNEDLVLVENDLEDVVFEDVSAGGKVYKLSTGDPDLVGSTMSPNEYFLVEHRRPGISYYERNLPAAGLLVWHIVSFGSTNSYEEAKRVDLECADGRYLDAGYPLGSLAAAELGGDNLDFWAHDGGYRRAHGGNLGDATDVYDGVVYTEFSARSNPSSPKRISVTHIRRQGARMLADLHRRDRRRAGAIVGEEVWDDTVKVVGDVVVQPDSRLLIAPGTVVLFEADQRRGGVDPQRCELVVEGELSIEVSRGYTTLLTSAEPNPRPGDWYGVVVRDRGQVDLPETVLEFAHDGLSGSDLQRPLILRDVVIRRLSRYGIRFAGIREPITLQRVEVSGSGLAGVWVEGSGITGEPARDGGGDEPAGSFVVCVDNKIIDNGLEREEGANVVVGPGVLGRIAHNFLRGGVGIRCEGSDEVLIEENQLSEHRIGLISSSARPQIAHNEFIRNELALQISGSQVPGRLEQNGVRDATWLLDNQATTEVMAANNWWGGIDEGWIESRISGAVQWQPILNFDPQVPTEFVLEQNYPNPFNGSTVINFSIGLNAAVEGGRDMVVEVRTITGGLVRRLLKQQAVPGFYSVAWDGRNKNGKAVASGVYLYVLRVGLHREMKRLLLIK